MTHPVNKVRRPRPGPGLCCPLGWLLIIRDLPSALQSFLNNALKQNAGLNPREYRAVNFKSASVQGRPHSNTMLDMTLLLRYVSLDLVTQHNLARSVGTNPLSVMESLRALEESIQFWQRCSSTEGWVNISFWRLEHCKVCLQLLRV